jgi:hypothetical protein
MFQQHQGLLDFVIARGFMLKVPVEFMTNNTVILSLNHFVSVLFILENYVLLGIYRTAMFYQSCLHLWLNTPLAFLVVVHISTVPFQILEGCPFHY